MTQELELRNLNKWSSEGNLFRLDQLIERGFNVNYDYEEDIIYAWKG